MRTLGVVLVFAVLAQAEDHPELRKLINGFRSDLERKNLQLVFPRQLGRLPADLRLTVEFAVGHYFQYRGVLWFEPQGGAVRVRRLYLSRDDLDWRSPPAELRGAGVVLEETTLKNAQYKALLTDLQLLRHVTLVGKSVRNPRRWGGGTADGEFRMQTQRGDAIEIWCKSKLPAAGSGANEQVEKFGGRERALLYCKRVFRTTDEMEFTRARIGDEVATRMVDALMRCKGGDEAWLESVSFASEVLSALGHQRALKELRRIFELEKAAGWGREFVVESGILKLEALAADDAPARLGALIDDGADIHAPWARVALLKRHPDAFAARAIKQFDSGDLEARREAIEMVRVASPSDLALARRGLKDAELAVQVDCARWIWDVDRGAGDWERVVELVGTPKGAGITRGELAHWMGRVCPSDRRAATFDLLFRMLADTKADVGARIGAARGLGALGKPGAVPLLRALYRNPPLEELRGPVALALGELLAVDAAPELIAYLASRPEATDEEARYFTARALCMLAVPGARESLLKERGKERAEHARETWTEFIALIDLLHAKDGGPRLLAWKSYWTLPPRVVSFHLARLCTVEQLTALKAEFPARQAGIDAAMARKRG